MRLPLTLTLILLLSAFTTPATTWDEPWHETVVKDADAFIKATVTQTSPKSITLNVLKHLAGEKTPDTLTVDRFSLVRLTSITAGDDHELGFNFAKDAECYFFLKKVKADGRDAWAIATPTTGFAAIAKGKVHATYRHSYHQAVVPEDLYAPSTIAIFQHLHNQKYDEPFVRNLIKTELTQPPRGLTKGDDAGQKTFFRQHVALECFYHVGLPAESPLLEPFLSFDDYHTGISAVRALSRIDTPDSRQRLFDLLITDRSAFSRVMAAWGLKRLDAREYLPKLRDFAKIAPDKEAGFGGNIMDPRVGTHFPRSVKAACEELLAEWDPTTKPPALR
jgi:hypothetical protein